jgi:hypothetical protein
MGARESIVVLAVALLCACSSGSKPGPGEAAASAADATHEDKGKGAAGKDDEGQAAQESGADVVLTSDQVAKIGIVTTAVRAVTYAPGAQGFGVVVSHDVIAQVAADLQTATAALHQSQAVLDRGKRLASGPGALGQDAVETAIRQVAADQAALELARRKLTAVLGQEFPRQRRGAPGLLNELANGTVKLARITFPPAALGSERPRRLRISQLDSTPVASWSTGELWDAPQDPALPGRSFFALLNARGIPEGARLQALAVSAAGTAGVLIPSAAVVVTSGQYWCYVQKKAGTFERTPIDASRPLADGYFVSAGVAPGEQVVTSAAGLLLARQMNASTEAPD